MEVLLNELGVLCCAEAAAGGLASTPPAVLASRAAVAQRLRDALPKLRLDMGEQARREKHLLLPESERGAEMWAYWQEQLAAPLPQLDFPADFPRSSSVSSTGDAHGFMLDSALMPRMLHTRTGGLVFLFKND